MSAQVETERPTLTDAFRQGDIIRLEYPEDGSCGPDLGVIINADCDLENRKTDGVIAYLPIYSFHDYLAQYWAPGYVEEVKRRASESILEIAQDSKSDEETLQSWLRTAGSAVVIAKLSNLDFIRKNQARTIELSVQRLSICLQDDTSHVERVGRLCRLENDPVAFAQKQIASAKKNLGDGHFFISELVGEDSIGFVIRMRRIYTIDESCCFSSRSDFLSKGALGRASAVRSARLTPLYRFRVIQLFSQQYSRVGLSDEITALADLAVESMVDRLIRDPK